MTGNESAFLWLAVGAVAVASFLAAARLRWDTAAVRGAAHLASVIAIALAAAILVARGRAAGEFPVAAVFDVLVLLSTTIILLYLMTAIRLPSPALGVFALPLALAVLLLAAIQHTGEPSLRRDLPPAGTIAHVMLTILGLAGLAFAAICGLMYLIQQSRLRSGAVGPVSAHLPDLEKLERWTRAAIVAGFVLVTAGLGLGLALLASRGREFGFSPADPKVISSLVVWGLFALLVVLGLHRRLRGRPVARLTLIVFLLMILTVVAAGVLWPTHHMFSIAP